MSENPSASVEEAAGAYLTATGRIAVRRELSSLVGELEPGEAPITVSRGALLGRFGLIAVTDQRLIFIDKARLDSKSRSIPMREIGWVTSGVTPLGYGMLKVGPHRSDGKVLKIKVIPKERAGDIASAIEPFIDPIEAPAGEEFFEDDPDATPAQAEATPKAAPAQPPSVQIGKLHELHEAGLITDEEFKKREAAILSEVMDY
ncbi:MAG: hypothetical protein DCC49_05000 [Acidobacteria bacterium]|nr:MAG: hypothetical protein DCC49_05000 [Acidobacteriota bacterium]